VRENPAKQREFGTLLYSLKRRAVRPAEGANVGSEANVKRKCKGRRSVCERCADGSKKRTRRSRPRITRYRLRDEQVAGVTRGRSESRRVDSSEIVSLKGQVGQSKGIRGGAAILM